VATSGAGRPTTWRSTSRVGPRGSRRRAGWPPTLILGDGLDVTALRTLSARARAARTAAGITTPLRIWGFVTTYIAPERQPPTPPGSVSVAARWAPPASRSARPSRTRRARGLAADPAGAAGPLRLLNHGVGAGNTNGYLFDDHPDLQEYLVNRFQLLGTADECAGAAAPGGHRRGPGRLLVHPIAADPDEDRSSGCARPARRCSRCPTRAGPGLSGP